VGWLNRYAAGWYLAGKDGSQLLSDQGVSPSPFTTEEAARAWARSYGVQVAN